MSALTHWTNEAVAAVVQGEREVIGLERHPYGVGEQSFTGGPVLRGPWGTIGGMQSDWSRFENECKRLIAACIHGQLLAARRTCEEVGCTVVGSFCHRCGGVKT